MVHDGAKTATLTLIGTYAASSFHLADDGHGGTYVSDPPAAHGLVQAAASPAPLRLVEAAAGLRPGGRYAAAVHAGGHVFAAPPPLLTAATSGR